jgi:hypothetical protein
MSDDDLQPFLNAIRRDIWRLSRITRTPVRLLGVRSRADVGRDRRVASALRRRTRRAARRRSRS